jgi:hypothetical protein
LGTGLCYLSNGTWLDSEELVEPAPGGAAARRGQHKVTFANNLATAGAITFEKDGIVLQTSVLGLSYFDTANGDSVLIAGVKDCQGTIETPNRVLYKNAFTDITASVRYTYTKAGFEQDIILEQEPPAPEEYGLSSASTVLQVLTEVFSPPQPSITQRTLQLSADASVGDDYLDFHTFRLGTGKAFLLARGGQPAHVRSLDWLPFQGLWCRRSRSEFATYL